MFLLICNIISLPHPEVWGGAFFQKKLFMGVQNFGGKICGGVCSAWED